MPPSENGHKVPPAVDNARGAPGAWRRWTVLLAVEALSVLGSQATAFATRLALLGQVAAAGAASAVSANDDAAVTGGTYGGGAGGALGGIEGDAGVGAADFTTTALWSTVAAAAPLLALPFAGHAVDAKWGGPRRVMTVADIGAALATVAIAFVLWLNSDSPSGIRSEPGTLLVLLLATCVSGACGAAQWPAFEAVAARMLDGEQLEHASGISEAVEAFAELAAPALAGLVMAAADAEGSGLWMVFAFDSVTVVAALLVVNLVDIPDASDDSEQVATDLPVLTGYRAWLDSIREGWRELSKSALLCSLLVASSAAAFFEMLAAELLMPLAVSVARSEVAVVGTLTSAVAAGAVLGGAVVGAWGCPHPRVTWALTLPVIQASILVGSTALHLTPQVLAAAGAAFYFASPVTKACLQTEIAAKVSVGKQGRAFALREFLIVASEPLAAAMSVAIIMLASGLLAPTADMVSQAALLTAFRACGVAMACCSVAIWVWGCASASQDAIDTAAALKNK